MDRYHSGDLGGTRPGRARHPPAAHEDGTDIDVAYYQVGTRDNALRAICVHADANGEQNHCVEPPTTLDAMRTALFIGTMMEESIVRVVGVDGQAGPLIEAALARLCAAHAHWIRARACRRALFALSYETVDEGHGWYAMHHHHLHIGTFLPPERRRRH